jgi:hypothetical protein
LLKQPVAGAVVAVAVAKQKVAKQKVAVADEAANPSRQFAGPSFLKRKGWPRWSSFFIFLFFGFWENSF